jgi:hypothetical protein
MPNRTPSLIVLLLSEGEETSILELLATVSVFQNPVRSCRVRYSPVHHTVTGSHTRSFARVHLSQSRPHYALSYLYRMKLL